MSQPRARFAQRFLALLAAAEAGNPTSIQKGTTRRRWIQQSLPASCRERRMWHVEGG
jgi:hypothetical protein